MDTSWSRVIMKRDMDEQTEGRGGSGSLAPPDGQPWWPVVYDELRRVARARMAGQPAGHTLQATALVHEAWLRLGSTYFRDRGHFFRAAAQAMQHVLADRARKRQCERHGAGWHRIDLDEAEITAPADDETVLMVQEAVDRLTAQAPEIADVVKLRFFVGLDASETAEVLGVSQRTVERFWTYGKSWLFTHLGTDRI
jgi:RNA polymerase sigma factor (TIGR02999 family)